jgi:hypothetical protein
MLMSSILRNSLCYNETILLFKFKVMQSTEEKAGVYRWVLSNEWPGITRGLVGAFPQPILVIELVLEELRVRL